MSFLPLPTGCCSYPDCWPGQTVSNRCRCDEAIGQLRRQPPSREVVRLLDRISDSACHAADAAKFCADVHSDPAWRDAASAASDSMCEYIAQLNTKQVLCDKLAATMEAVEAASEQERQADGWTQEEVAVGASLLLEFEHAGMGQRQEVREEYRALMQHQQTLTAQLAHFEV